MRIPAIVSDVNPQAARTPYVPQDIGVAMEPGEALAGFGKGISAVGNVIAQYAEKQKQITIATEYNKRVTDAKLNADAAVSAREQSPDFNPATHVAGVTSDLQAIRDQTLKGVKDPELQLHLDTFLQDQKARALIDARYFAGKKNIQAAQGEFDRANTVDLEKAATATGPDLDNITSDFAGRLAMAEHNQLFTPAEIQRIGEEWFKNVHLGQLDVQMRNNPAGTRAMLQAGVYELDPETTQRAITSSFSQEYANQQRAEKIANDLRDASHAQKTQLAVDGQYTHAQATIDAAKFGWKSDQIESIFNAINKSDAPSDPATKDRMILSVYRTNPTITESQLMDETRKIVNGKPALSSADYRSLQPELASRMKALDAPDSGLGRARSLGDSTLENLLGTNRAILAQAKIELSKTPAYALGIGSISDAAVAIANRLKAPIEAQGGLGVASGAAETNLKEARNSFTESLKQQREWNTHWHPFSTNPFTQSVDQGRASTYNAAVAAGKNYAPPPDKADGLNDGATYMGPDGKAYLVIEIQSGDGKTKKVMVPQ